MQNRPDPIFVESRIPTFLLILGCVEFCGAAVLSLGIDPDPKNAFLFGYSLPRLALAGLSLICAVSLLFLAWSAASRKRVIRALEIRLQGVPLASGLIVALLAGLAIIIGITPFEVFGKLGLYFVRARSFFFVFCLYPAQFSLYWLQSRKWHQDRVLIRLFFISLGVLVAFGGFIILSGLGITPDTEYWNPAGSPVTTLQLCVVLWIGLFVFGLFGFVKTKLPVKRVIYLDVLIALCLFASALYFWMRLPSPHNEFSTRPAAPYFQSYPHSDAAVHDVGSLSILKGSGIYFGKYTDKPLYMVFLALLHLVGGYDYNFLIVLHAGFMALMVPGLYFLGKLFHSRMFGFFLASVILIRQYNAISLSNLLYFNATPRQFLTEVPTLVGLIFFTLAFFLWVKTPSRDTWRAFVTGGILGAVSLIRLNPFLLILAVPVFLFFCGPKHKKAWLTHSLTFLLGCSLVIAPWVVTGKDPSGTPYFLVKFFDIIHVRYGPLGAVPTENGFQFANISSGSVSALAPLSAGFNPPPLSTKTFPGFVINHTLHNFVGAFLSLPDSVQINDQYLDVLMSRPYWALGKEIVTLQQIPFLLLNLVFLALGLGWAWKRWKWAGFVPLFVFVVYALSLGFGRTSGSRFLVPIDWVVDFYFLLGLICLFHLTPAAFRHLLDIDQDEIVNAETISGQTSKRVRFGAVAFVLCLAAFVPVAQNLIPPQAPFCQPDNLSRQVPLLLEQAAPKEFAPVYGEVLYPELKNEHFSFGLLTCHASLSFEIDGLHEKLSGGQQILAGLSDNGPNPKLLFIALPKGENKRPQIIWMKP